MRLWKIEKKVIEHEQKSRFSRAKCGRYRDGTLTFVTAGGPCSLEEQPGLLGAK
jgi:hypothetical protein